MEEKETYMEEKRYCRKCGAELKGQGKFCPKCGEPILSEEPPKGKKKGRKIAIVTIGIIGILGIGTVVAYSYLGKQEEKKNHVTAVKEDNEKKETKESKEDFVETNEAEDYFAIIKSEGGKEGLINGEGGWVTPCIYEDIDLYSQESFGLIEVMNSEEKIGFVDKKGDEIIPCQYEDSWGFSENGLAAVQKDGKWGYINEKASCII